MKKLTFSAAYLCARLAYFPHTGKLYWREYEPAGPTWNARYPWTPAFTTYDQYGYLTGKLDHDRYLAHRVIWLMYWGVMLDEWQVDHRNHVRDDNRMDNLCVTDSTGQRRNQTLRSTNFAGVHGVTWSKERNRWIASIKDKGKTVNLGRFVRVEDAIEARLAAEKLYGYHANHGK